MQKTAILFVIAFSAVLVCFPQINASAKEVSYRGTSVDLIPQADKTWITMDPLQCPEYSGGMDNWSKAHNNATYPVGQGNDDTSIKNYYKKQGIVIFDTRIVSWPDTGVCAACSCPTGDTLYLLVSNSDVSKMQKFGYSIILGEIKQGPKPSVNQTGNTTLVSHSNISIISVQATDQQAHHVLKFARGTNGFAKVILSSQSDQMALTTVDLIASDLTSLGTGSIKSILNQTGSQMTLSFFIPDSTKNGTANICVDVYSDWPDKGGFPLAPESCVKVQIGSATRNHGNNTVDLEEIIGINDSTPNEVTNSTISTQDIECTSSTNDTQSVDLDRDNYLQSKVTLRAGQKVFPLLVQKICPDHVVGLVFYAYPVCCHPESVILHIGDSAGGCGETHFTLLSIQGKTATFSTSIHNGGGCPICLSGTTMIDTPNGPISVKELKIGMPVWTMDNYGHKQTSVVSKTSKIPVPFTHVMIHLMLADGRQLFVSPNHPTTDGRQIRDLKMGDTLYGVQVKTIEFVSYHEHFTYDILPSGPTGFYWANGILIGSTLK